MAITLPYTFVQGTVIDATQVNANFAALANGVNNTTGSGAVYVLAQSPSIDAPTITTQLTVNGTVSLATPLAVASGGVGVATLPAGQLVQGNGTNPVSGVPLPLSAANGGTGQTSLPLSVANGGTGTTAAKAVLGETAPGDPPGAGPGPAIMMMGLGAALRITPAVSGTVCFSISFQASLSAAAAAVFGLNYGSGTAPGFASPQAGTMINSPGVTWSSLEASAYTPITLVGLVSGLTVGTAYWFDIALSSVDEGTYLSSVTGFAFEV